MNAARPNRFTIEKFVTWKTGLYILLGLLAILWIAPILWMASTAFKPERMATMLPLTWIPREFNLENFRSVLLQSLILRWLFNSVVVAVVTTVVVVIIDALAGYTFARLDFYGKTPLFYLVLATMMVPEQVTVVPLYVFLSGLGLINTYTALVAPRLALALGVFLLRQFFAGMPIELEEAATIDGCSRFGLFYRIALPLARPALSALTIVTFIRSWNNFLWPLVAVTSEKMFTLPVGLANFQGTYEVEYAKIMAAAFIASIPVLAVFLAFQRQFIQGIALTGLKG